MAYLTDEVHTPEIKGLHQELSIDVRSAEEKAALASTCDGQPEHLEESVSTQHERPSSVRNYLTGWRLFAAGFGLGLSVLLPALEASVISTSLVGIASDLEGFSQSSWVVTAYLLTYTGFLIIWSKFTDIMGLKPALVGSLLLFTAFSGACGGAQTMNQLIIFRAFQGVGGAGVYAVTTIGFVQLVPPEKYNLITMVASSLMTLGLIIGPLVGGAITNSHHWRWIFLLNLPAGALALVVCVLVFPSRFPHHTEDVCPKTRTLWSFKSEFLEKADLVGGFLLLSASVLLVAALSEGGVRFAWNSGVTISFFVVSGALWAIFFAWEKAVDCSTRKIEPMWPWRFLRNRVWVGVLSGCFLSGAPLTIAIINLPQYYQLVNASNPLQAGVRVLPYAITCPIGIVTSTVLTGRARIPFVFVLLIGIVLQITGFALLSTVPTTVRLWTGQYGYTVIAGLGSGISVSCFYMMGPIVVEKRDQALAIGSTLQVRTLGGAVGIAIVNSVSNSYVRSHLKSVLGSEQLKSLLSSVSDIGSLPSAVQDTVRRVYGEGYNWQMRVTIAFSAAQILAVVLIWKKKPLRLSKEGTAQ